VKHQLISFVVSYLIYFCESGNSELVRWAGNGVKEKEGEPTWRSLTFEPGLDVSQPVDLHLAIRSNAVHARSLTADASNTKLEILDCAGEDLEIGHCSSLAALGGLRNFNALWR
jgi:hypothetical protein